MRFHTSCIAVAILLGAANQVFSQDEGPCTPTIPQVDAEERPRNPLVAIGTDFKNLVTTRENLVILGVGGGTAWAAGRFDQSISESRLNSELYPGTAWDRAFESGEVLGGAAVQVGAAAVTYGVGEVFSNPGLAELGGHLVRAQIVSVALTQTLKHTVGRQRPDGSNGRSFPSGHASGTFATASVLQRRYGWKVGAPAFAVAGFVAGSRLSEDRHYLSDVIFGATLGIMAGRTVTLDVAEARFAVGPMLIPGGVGVQLTWIGSGPQPE